MKNLINKYVGILAVTGLLFSCGGSDDGPPPPPPVPENNPPGLIGTVQFPTANLLCIDNNIEFDWDDAVDPDGDPVTYRIIIATDRDLTPGSIVEDRVVNQSEVTIMLERGIAYYWNVETIDNEQATSGPSPTLAFFTMGFGEENSVPFTAALVSPGDGMNVDAGNVTLSWMGADADPDDVLSFDVFFGTDPNPPALANGMGISEEMINVDAPSAATTYYWRVNTTDGSGSSSIGRVWQFTTN